MLLHCQCRICFGCHFEMLALRKPLPSSAPSSPKDGRGSSGIGKSIGLAEGILLPAEAVDSNRSRPNAFLEAM